MIKLYLKLRRIKKSGGWEKGEVVEMINDVFDKNTGIAYIPLHNDWEIIKMEIREFKQIHV